jgi:hypothetical protein
MSDGRMSDGRIAMSKRREPTEARIEASWAKKLKMLLLKKQIIYLNSRTELIGC